MELAAEISALKLARKIGRTMQVLVDRTEGDTAIARSAGDAPQIDGTVRIHGGKSLKIGQFADVRITGGTALRSRGAFVAPFV